MNNAIGDGNWSFGLGFGDLGSVEVIIVKK